MLRGDPGEVATRPPPEALDALYATAPVGLAVLDRDLRFVHVNAWLAATNGCPACAHLGRTPGEVAPEPGAAIESLLRRVVETGMSLLEHPVSVPGRAPGGDQTYLVSAAPQTGEAGEVEGISVVVQDVSSLLRAQRALEATGLAEERARAQERARIAQVLHDDLQQVLYGLRLRLGALRRELGVCAEADVARTFDGIDALAARALTVTRTLTLDLTPPVLAQEGLDASLAWLAELMRQTHGLEVRLHRDAPVPLRDADLHALLVQIVRELLFNVVKHAATRRTDVTVLLGDGRILLTVEDEGVGFDSSQLERKRLAGQGGFGLKNIRERLALFGGRMDIVSSPGTGTRVTLSLPIPPFFSPPPPAAT